jgi:hypothetical protein
VPPVSGLPAPSPAPGESPIACVVDVRLSLGAGGLFWVLGLARSLPVWLVQTHWAIVEDPFYLSQEPLLRWLAGEAGASIEASRAAVLESCETWREARRDLTLETRRHVYWPAERLAEAVVPKEVWPALVERCDALAAGLDRRRGRSPEAIDALADCARDALALVAALGGLGGSVPFLLTTLGAEETEPLLARSLDQARIPCRRLADGRWAERYEAALAPALVRTGLATALLAGPLRLAALQVVAPRVLSAAPADELDGDGDALDWDAAARGDEARHWDGASATCWTVPCGT